MEKNNYFARIYFNGDHAVDVILRSIKDVPADFVGITFTRDEALRALASMLTGQLSTWISPHGHVKVHFGRTFETLPEEEEEG